MSDIKQQIMDQVRQEAALNNARLLVEKINANCFDKCVPKPGTSLSSGETTCLNQCMDKYVAAWNTVSQYYLAQAQKQVGPGSSL